MSKIKYPILGYAPGDYSGKCVSCDQEFMGDKYARQCEPCAINSLNESHSSLLGEVKRLRSDFEQIEEAYNIIKNLTNATHRGNKT